MNKLFTLVLAFSLIVCFNSCKDDSMPPTDYHDFAIGAYTELDNEIAEFSVAIWDTTYTVDQLVEVYENCQKIIETNLPVLQETETLKDDPGLLLSVLDFYNNVYEIINNEYAEVLSFYEKEVWEDSYNTQIMDLYKKAVDELVEKEDAVIKAQEDFAAAYDILLND
ncbi:MAG: hypothetical protein JXL97_18055 [Bacteroidales bacterium]|nr:hypothetical protein [Bacteroidales bacterium]